MQRNIKSRLRYVDNNKLLIDRMSTEQIDYAYLWNLYGLITQIVWKLWSSDKTEGKNIITKLYYIV